MSDLDTETLDKLYLEWSQFTSARTARELAFIALDDELVREARERERESPSSYTEKNIAYGMRLAAKRIREILGET